MNLTTREKRIRLKLRDDFAYYAAKCLKIRSKSGAIEPLILNRAQQHVHERLESQKAASGKVRALILKGRQQGCSTYVEGRYYHRVSHGRGLRAFILTHEDAATQNLFEMVTRYHEHCHPLVKPSTGSAFPVVRESWIPIPEDIANWTERRKQPDQWTVKTSLPEVWTIKAIPSGAWTEKAKAAEVWIQQETV